MVFSPLILSRTLAMPRDVMWVGPYLYKFIRGRCIQHSRHGIPTNIPSQPYYEEMHVIVYTRHARTAADSGHCGNQFFLSFSFAQPTKMPMQREREKERENGPRPKLTHIFLPTPLSRWLQCDVGEWMAVPVPGPWYDQKGEGKTATTREKKTNRTRTWNDYFFISNATMVGISFSFLCAVRPIGRMCWVLGTQKTIIFVVFFFCFSFRTCCSRRIQIKDSVEYRTECFVLFFYFLCFICVI